LRVLVSPNTKLTHMFSSKVLILVLVCTSIQTYPMTRPPWLSATRPAAPAREPPVPRSDVPIARPTRGAGWHVAVGGPGDKPHQSGRARSTPALRTMRRDARKRRAGAADGAGTEQTAAATQAPPPPFAACTQFLLYELLACSISIFLLKQISHP
jgi:hypothetical protein